MTDLTLQTRLLPQSTPVTLSFEEYPNDCHFLRFASRQHEVTVTAAEFKTDAMATIARIAAAFDVTQGEEMILALENDYTLRIAVDGNHIRFVQGETERAYWVCDELQEASETENIMGAIAGYACAPYALPH